MNTHTTFIIQSTGWMAMKRLILILACLVVFNPTVVISADYDARYMVDLGFRIIDQMNTSKNNSIRREQNQDRYSNRQNQDNQRLSYEQQSRQIRLETERLRLKERELNYRERELKIRERENRFR